MDIFTGAGIREMGNVAADFDTEIESVYIDYGWGKG
jgi:hypothetical protein